MTREPTQDGDDLRALIEEWRECANGYPPADATSIPATLDYCADELEAMLDE